MLFLDVPILLSVPVSLFLSIAEAIFHCTDVPHSPFGHRLGDFQFEVIMTNAAVTFTYRSVLCELYTFISMIS